jgi:hypothetical protein
MVGQKKLERAMTLADSLTNVLPEPQSLERSLNERAPRAKQGERVRIDVDAVDRVRIRRPLPEDQYS